MVADLRGQKMAEYVKKENVLIALVSAGQCNTRYRLGEKWELNEEEIKKAIEYMYPEDVQPVVHGRWKGKKEYFGELHVPIYVWQCTACEGITPVTVDRYKYCPNCGAKMDGDKNV